ncbi:MAG: protein phosphatase 2C domain-containing protein [Acidimicrobiales bacterium]
MSTTEPGGAEMAQEDCAGCGAPMFEQERFCEVCGARVGPEPEPEPDPPRPTAPMQRVEQDLGVVAAVSDRGRRRPRNEDAMALATFEGRSAVVVCDGVASTANAHEASRVAVEMAIRVLEAALRHPPSDPEAWDRLFVEACAEAQIAVADVDAEGSGLAPSTTLVAVMATPGLIAVANIGDSRAYLLDGTPEGGRCLTVDDTWAEEMIADGDPPELAYADPDARTITRWVGADAASVRPAVTVSAVDRPGVVVVCTDGLWDYFDRPSALAALAEEPAGSAPLALARRLVEAALAAGGRDNVTVAVVPVAPAVAGATPGSAVPTIETTSEE